MGLYEVPLSMSLLGFGMGPMLANFHMCSVMLVLRAVFNMLLRNASPTGPMCFRCPMFSLSEPCGLLFIITLFYCLLDLSCGECIVIPLYSLYCSVIGSVCLVCCMFVNCLVNKFAICLGVVVILLLNVMEVLSVGVGGGALLDRLSMVFQRCVCCACYSSVHLDVPSIGLVCV